MAEKIDKDKKTQKARIIDASFDASTDTVIWRVELKNGDQLPMVWPRKDFGPALGIRTEIAASLIEEFNQKMLGKDFNLIIDQKIEINKPKDVK